MLQKKSFQTKIDEANKVFTVTVEKLRSVKSEIIEQISSNNSGIERLSAENEELESMASHVSRQIEQIGKFVG